MALDLTGVLVVAAIAFSAPLLVSLRPALRIPAVVVELVGGIAIGPSGLGWIELSPAIELLALIGLAFLLLLAGLEIEFERLRGRVLRLSSAAFVASFGLAVVAGLLLDAAGLVRSPLLIAIALAATSLGVVIPVLKDAGEIETPFGQLVIASASIADVATILLLSLFFSGESAGLGSKLVLLGGFFGLTAAVGVAILGAEHSARLSQTLLRLQDTTAQIRVRGAFVLLAAFVVLAEELGVEAILGAFTAGAILKLVDRDRMVTHPFFRQKLEAVGYGVFIPFFFVASGLRLDVEALVEKPANLGRVAVFFAALLAVRGLPAVLFRSLIGTRRTVGAGLLQATSLGFFVVVGNLGVDLGLISELNAAALVVAGLLSVLVFPPTALTLIAAPKAPDPAA